MGSIPGRTGQVPLYGPVRDGDHVRDRADDRPVPGQRPLRGWRLQLALRRLRGCLGLLPPGGHLLHWIILQLKRGTGTCP